MGDQRKEMAVAMYGADLAQLAALRQTFLTKAGDVEALKAAVTGTLSNTAWTGPAADNFRSQWEAEFRPALEQLRMALDECATVVESRRVAIEAATGLSA